MNRMIKHHDYLAKYLGFVLLIVLIAIGTTGGCGGNDSDSDMDDTDTPPTVGAPPTSVSFCQSSSDGEIINCTLPGNNTPPAQPSSIDLSDLVSALSSEGVTDDTIMWIQAWGGNGHAGNGELGAGPGIGGFAQTVTSLSDYEQTLGTSELHYYNGNSGDVDGGGGAATVVSSVDLDSTEPCAASCTSDDIAGGGAGGECQTCATNIVVIAGGGGGGSDENDSDIFDPQQGNIGGNGGVITSGISGADVAWFGTAGSGGGGVPPSGGGAFGFCLGGGSANGEDGGNGIGGPGAGSGRTDSDTVFWINTGSTLPNLANGKGGAGGAGGTFDASGAGGGGGCGGGGGGDSAGGTKRTGGGGGGGSTAVGSTQNDPVAPIGRVSKPDGTDTGQTRIVFHLNPSSVQTLDILDSGTVKVGFKVSVETGSRTLCIIGGSVTGIPGDSDTLSNGHGVLEVNDSDGCTNTLNPDDAALSNAQITEESCDGKQYKGTGTLVVSNVPHFGNITGTIELCGDFDSSTSTFSFDGDLTDIQVSGKGEITSVDISGLMLQQQGS